MSRRRKWVWRLIGLAGVVVAVVYFVILPIVVRRQVAKVLSNAGLGQATYGVSGVSLFQSSLVDFKASDTAAVKRLVIEYNPAALAHGRITGLRAEGLSLLIDLKAGQVDLGVIGELLSHKATTQPAEDGSATDETLPLDHIELVDSVVTLKTPHQEFRLPISGALTVQADGKLLLDAEVRETSSAVHVVGTLEPAKNRYDLRAASSAVDIPALAAVLQELLPSFHTKLSGNTSADVHYIVDGPSRSLSARVEPSDLIARIPYGQDRVTKLQFEKGVLNFEAAWPADESPSYKLSAVGLAVASEDNNARVDGLAASLAYGPNMESKSQCFTVASARIGKMLVTDGSSTFTVDAQRNVTIQKARCAWLGGLLSCENVRIQPGRPTDLVINGTSIDLKPLLESFASGRASGEGRIDLYLPLRIDGKRLGFGHGELKNIGPGQLQIADAAKVAQSVAQQAAKKDEQEKLKQDVIQALQDLDYEQLTLTLHPADGALSADAHLAGRGHAGAKKAVDLELHLSNVDDLLEFYLGIAGQLSGQ